MISVENARELICNTCRPGKSTLTDTAKSLGYVLAQTVTSPISLPSFDQSAMDGYAFRFEDKDAALHIVGIIQAGKATKIKLKKGEAVRIFTGACIPDGADTVVMQEHTEVNDDHVSIHSPNLSRGANIRRIGSQIKKGEIALKTGSLISPATIGFLASMGIRKVKVFAKPKIQILVNGNELKRSGDKIRKGEIHESNSVMLRSALSSLSISGVKTGSCGDHPASLLKKVKQALAGSDVLILTGGISVGDYDFTYDVLEKAGVEEVFYKVKQKPGKPLYVGKKGKKIIFALPGNPAAALTCFYEYVQPALWLLMGYTGVSRPSIVLPLTGTYSKKKGLTHFLKGVHDGKTVYLTEGQESFILRSFSEANCLVCIPEDAEHIAEGTELEVHPL